jgi:hypothetical protein
MRLVGLLVVLAALLASGRAAAQPPAAPGPAAVQEPGAERDAAASRGATSIDDERYAWLDKHLAAVETPTERWYKGWTWGFIWLAAGNASLGVVAPTEPQRQFAFTTSVESVLGLTSTLIQPHTMGGAREMLREYDASSAIGQYERRRRAEYVLYATASEENYWHSPVPHLLGVVAAAGGAGVLMGIYHQTAFGLLEAGATLGAVELQIWTRPTSATKAWREYEKWTGEGKPAEVGPDAIDLFSVSFAVTPGGVAAVGTF